MVTVYGFLVRQPQAKSRGHLSHCLPFKFIRRGYPHHYAAQLTEVKTRARLDRLHVDVDRSREQFRCGVSSPPTIIITGSNATVRVSHDRLFIGFCFTIRCLYSLQTDLCHRWRGKAARSHKVYYPHWDHRVCKGNRSHSFFKNLYPKSLTRVRNRRNRNWQRRDVDSGTTVVFVTKHSSRVSVGAYQLLGAAR